MALLLPTTIPGSNGSRMWMKSSRKFAATPRAVAVLDPIGVGLAHDDRADCRSFGHSARARARTVSRFQRLRVPVGSTRWISRRSGGSSGSAISASSSASSVSRRAPLAATARVAPAAIPEGARRGAGRGCKLPQRRSSDTGIVEHAEAGPPVLRLHATDLAERDDHCAGEPEGAAQPVEVEARRSRRPATDS